VDTRGIAQLSVAVGKQHGGPNSEQWCDRGLVAMKHINGSAGGDDSRALPGVVPSRERVLRSN
jgi:hypothetical protein